MDQVLSVCIIHFSPLRWHEWSNTLCPFRAALLLPGREGLDKGLDKEILELDLELLEEDKTSCFRTLGQKSRKLMNKNITSLPVSGLTLLDAL